MTLLEDETASSKADQSKLAADIDANVTVKGSKADRKREKKAKGK